jgi:hypothetical protein
MEIFENLSNNGKKKNSKLHDKSYTNLLYWLSRILKNLLFIVKRVSNIRIIGKRHGKWRNWTEQPANHLAQLIFIYFFCVNSSLFFFFLRILYFSIRKKIQKLGRDMYPTTTNHMKMITL